MSRFKTERQMQAKALLKDGDYTSIRDMICRLNAMYPERDILAELDENKEIRYYKAKDIFEEVMNLGDGMIDAGLRGSHIAIISENSCRYVISDICISNGVGIVTPLDKDASVEQLAVLAGKCDAEAILCDHLSLNKALAIKGLCPAIRTIMTIDRKVDGYLSYDELVEKGKSLKERSIYRKIELDPDQPAKFLFTSGTTGANKCVILTNANLTANMVNCMDTIKAVEGNTSMSVLPMHHATEINTHVMTRIGSGRLTYINGNMRNMMVNMKIFKPDIITIVPMIANMFYKTIWKNTIKAGKEEKLKKGIKLCRLLKKIGIDRTHELFSEIFEPFGGKLHMIVCGGSMLNPVVIKGLNDIGIRMENGYGITECGPLISMNSDTLKEHLSVGRPCPGLEAKIINKDENGVGELCVRGRSVAKGYYKDEQATKEAFMEDGFFNTGDSAFMDSKGRITLVGRKKNTIVLESGKNVCPEEIENIIETKMEYVNEAVVYQASYYDNDISRHILCANVFIQDEDARADIGRIERDFRDMNESLPYFKNIDYVELSDKEFEKTAAKKIIRTKLPSSCSGKGIKIF